MTDTRTPLIAGNWKCNTRRESARSLAVELRERLDYLASVEKVVCPPFVYLPEVRQALNGSTIRIGGQDIYWADDVAATGEVGPKMLAEMAEYVIVGHSERRHQLGETDDMVNRKVEAALAAGLLPIMCIGETLEERQAGLTDSVLLAQTRNGLAGMEIPGTFVIAYEPVWAIGAGIAATVDDASSAIDLVRDEVKALFGGLTAGAIRILYGGSVTPGNIADFVSQDGIDGALVGGASLKAESFSAIVEATARVAPVGKG